MTQNNGLAQLNKSSVELNKLLQKRTIVGLLHKYGYTSAPELSKKLKISLPNCLSILSDLIDSGFIENIGIGVSSGGRKPALYGLSESKCYVVACDVARFSASMAILNSANKFVTPIIQIETHIDDSQFVEKIIAASEKLIHEYQLPEAKIMGFGVDMPGLIDSKCGVNYTIKKEKYQNVGFLLAQRFKKLVYIDNDARMHAYGEYCFGSAKGYENAIIIHWSWGLGLGIFVNGKLYSGNHGFAGEFSHIPIVENGDLCICGKRGCLETIASSNTILKRVKQGVSEGEISSIVNRFHDNPESVTPEDIIAAARLGDEFSISILNEIGIGMGKGLSYIIQLLNPEVIVLSGPISKANQYVLSPIQQSLNRLCLEKISGNTSILISDQGDLSALLGTSEMVLQQVFAGLNFT
ncbi:MAG: ROK family transcriptional regulator [Prolixibacteraceae bacterium]|nr:ROK family transcriptional regulator [Prolixibacteraceae bacterium]